MLLHSFHHIKLWLSVSAALCCPLWAAAQSPLAQPVDFDCENCRPADALVALSRQTGVNIVFAEYFFERCKPLSIHARQEPLERVVTTIAACSKRSYTLLDGQVVFSPDKKKYTLSGYVQDEATGERLLGTSIGSLTEQGKGTVTNEFGFFSLRLEEGEHRLALARVGYDAAIRNIDLNADRLLVLKLRPNTMLPEVLIRPAANRDTNPQTVESISPIVLSVNDLKFMPAPGGEPDLMRQIALEPGVQTGVDGLGGLHVRGGNADQNLILLDDVPVYNPSHALGLFSIFNTHTVSQARLWKGDFPARYGGRASSVLDVRTRDGNMRDYHTNASMGLFAGSITAEGPIARDRSSFLVGVRTTYFEPWVKLFSERGDVLTFSGDDVAYRFYDVNAKLNYVLSPRDRVYLSFYQGGDLFRNRFEQNYISEEGITTDSFSLRTNWGNTIAALRWNHVLRPNLFTNTTLRFSRFLYQSRLGFNSGFLSASGKASTLANYGQIYQTLIRDASAKTDFTFYANERFTARWGMALTRHAFQPGALAINLLQPGQSPGAADSLANVLLNNESLLASEVEGYFDADRRFARRWRMEAGLHGSVFSGKNVNYRALLPRLRVQRTGQRGWSIWAGYHRSAQYLHQIGSFNVSLPFELWVPSTRKVEPERVGQWTAGLGWQRGGWRWQVEGYDKRLDRVLTFISSNDALYNGGAEDASGWEDRITEGSGRSRGVEFLLEKNRGSTTGSLAYTLSKTARLFPELNSGEVFPFRFDRRHDLKITVRQRITRWLEADAVWAFATGNPITLAGAKFTYQSANGEVERSVFVYTSVNGYRLPNYHRLDASLTAQFGKKKLRHLVQLSVYNAYNRANPFYRYVDTSGNKKTNAVDYTLLPVLPGLRYEIRF